MILEEGAPAGAEGDVNLELFPCSGGMAEGFRRAGIAFDLTIDVDSAACDSYETNMGSRPVRMDVHDLVRLARLGAFQPRLRLLIADPPCTPWSRAGKRRGTADERDCLTAVVELIELLRPVAWLVANVPGLDDSGPWATVVQPLLGGMATRAGYCVDFARLDAADYGQVIPCPLHDADPLTTDAAVAASVSRAAIALACVVERATTPTVEQPTYRALTVVGHLARAIRAACAVGATPEERLRSLRQLALEERRTRCGEGDGGWMSEGMSACGDFGDSDTAASIGAWLRCSWDALSRRERWSTMSMATQATTIRRIWRCIAATAITGPRTGTAPRSAGCGLCLDDGVPQRRVRPFWFGHPVGAPCLRWPEPTHCDPALLTSLPLPGFTPPRPWVTCREALAHLPLEELGRPVRLRWRDGTEGDNHCPSRPRRTLTCNTHSDGALLTLDEDPRSPRPPSTKGPQWSRIGDPDAPAPTVLTDTARATGSSPRMSVSLLDRTRSRQKGDEIGSSPDVPARVVGVDSRTDGRVLVVNGGHPVAECDGVAPTLRSDGGRAGRRESVLTRNPKHATSASPAADATIGAKDRGPQSGQAIEWPWDRPATTVQSDERIAAPGHHEWWSIMSDANAVVLSERAAAILQGFPDPGQPGGWRFVAATKRVRWSQIGMAMPPPLAEAVARSIAERVRSTDKEDRR